MLGLLLVFPAFAGGQQEPAEAATTEETTAAELGLFDPRIPQSWNEDYRTASDWGITQFSQSPMLDARVDSGELPPVEERLTDPMVLEPFESVGRYGGTMIVYGTGLDNNVLGHLVHVAGDTGFIVPPNGDNKVIGSYAERFEYNEDYTSITLYFRDGLRWSDGEPFHAGTEMEFLWNHIVLNDDISQGYRPENVVDVEIVDENTYTLHLSVPEPRYQFGTYVLRNLGFDQPYLIGPSHAIKEYHPDFVGEAEAARLAQEMGFNSVSEAILELVVQGTAPHYPQYNMPTIRPYRAIERTETIIVYERNPYYAFVDTEGNQLPYIDYIELNRASNREVASINAVTGQSHMDSHNLVADDIPLYIENEARGNYRTLIYNNPAPGTPVYIMNFTDPTYGHVFRDVRFRRALSLAIDRDDLNERFFFGRANPMQITAPTNHPLYRDEWAQSYAEFDPETARALLDEMGMVDVTGNGWRETPEGEQFRPTLMHLGGNANFGTSSFNERVMAFWNEIGIDVTMDTVQGAVFWGARNANDFQITMHPADGMFPDIGPAFTRRSLAPARSANHSSWNDWARWISSGGEIGEEPEDPFIFELAELGDRYLSAGDMDALEVLLGHLAENLWAIGTVGNAPMPVIVNNSLRNVPEANFMTFPLQNVNVARMQQWYFDE